MNAKKLYYVLLGCIGLSVLVLLGGAFASNKILQAHSKTLLDAKTRNSVADAKQQQLIKQRADINKYKDLGEIARNIVPQDKDQAQTVRELVAIANANGVKLGTITFPSSTLGATGTGAAAKAQLSQLLPVKGITGVYSMNIVVQSDSKPVAYGQFLSFLDALEHNRRTALVSNISIVPDGNDPSKLTFTLNLSEYIKP